MANNFKDKVVIVTGANSGIGEATAQLFLEQGAKIAALDIRTEKEGLEGSKLSVKCNVASNDSVVKAVQQVVDTWGTVDVLCNIAGVMDAFERVGNQTDEQWDKVMGINVNGPFYVTRAVIPIFLKKDGPGRKGAIVNVGSIASKIGSGAGAAYTTAKHAVLGLTKHTAVLYQKDQITCNIVLPGPVKTNIQVNSEAFKLDEVGRERLAPAQSRVGGYCDAVDIARAIVFLAGAEGANGAELAVDHSWIAS